MNKTRLGNLDLLKFFAACCIVLHHFQQFFGIYFENYLNFFGGKFYFGNLVELFFIISGFLTAKSKRNDGFYNNVKKHWLRLFPYAFIATFFSCIVLFAYRIKMHTLMPGVDYSVLNIISSLFMVHQGWVFQFIGINNPTWYLCVLMWLYIVYYAINALSTKMGKNSMKFSLIAYSSFIALGMIIQLFGLKIPFLYENDARGYIAFFLGVIIYLIHENTEKNKQIIIGALLCIVGTAVILLLGEPVDLRLTLFVFPGILLILVSIRQIEIPFISVLGQVSFEMYVWHTPIYMLIYLLFSNMELFFLHHYGIMIVCLLAIIGFAFIAYYTIELPLSKKIGKLLNSAHKPEDPVLDNNR